LPRLQAIIHIVAAGGWATDGEATLWVYQQDLPILKGHPRASQMLKQEQHVEINIEQVFHIVLWFRSFTLHGCGCGCSAKGFSLAFCICSSMAACCTASAPKRP